MQIIDAHLHLPKDLSKFEKVAHDIGEEYNENAFIKKFPRNKLNLFYRNGN